MDAVIGKAGKRLFEKHLEKYAPSNPLYESYTDERGKIKRRQRPLPPGLSKRDAQILKAVRRRAHRLDKGFNFCGFRFGWTFFIGLIPVVGDVTNMSLNHFLVIQKAKQAEIPRWLVNRMQLHNIVSTGVGFIPFVGDVVVAVYKVNSRNAALLEEFLRIRGEEFLRQNPQGSGQVTGNVENRRGGWSWLTRQGLSAKDVEQVNPGAGITDGEIISDPSNAGTSNPVSGMERSADTGRSATQDTHAPLQKGQTGFSIFRGGKKTTTQKDKLAS